MAVFKRTKVVDPSNIDSKVADEMESEHLQTHEKRSMFKDAAKCILCSFSVAACSVKFKQNPNFVGSATGSSCARYIFDFPVADSKERMKIWEKSHRIWNCKSYHRRTQVCPKRIRITEVILKTEKKILEQLHPK